MAADLISDLTGRILPMIGGFGAPVHMARPHGPFTRPWHCASSCNQYLPPAGPSAVIARGRKSVGMCYVFWLHIFAIHGLVHW